MVSHLRHIRCNTVTSGQDLIHIDTAFLAANKPAGLAVHRSRMVGTDDDYLVDRLRRHVDGPLHPAHRLDRATSGLVLVARSNESAAALGRQLMARDVEKTYLAVVRGWPAETGVIDHPLSVGGLTGAPKPASTRWQRLATVEVPIEMGRYPQQRYALLALSPQTGRYRQLRRHLHHVHHPIIGDTSHGRGDHNRLFREHFRCHRMLLHAWRLSFAHPDTGMPVSLAAPLDDSFLAVLDAFGWTHALDEFTAFDAFAAACSGGADHDVVSQGQDRDRPGGPADGSDAAPPTRDPTNQRPTDRSLESSA